MQWLPWQRVLRSPVFTEPLDSKLKGRKYADLTVFVTDSKNQTGLLPPSLIRVITWATCHSFDFVQWAFIKMYIIWALFSEINFERKIVKFSSILFFNICFGCSKESSHWDGSYEYPQHMFNPYCTNRIKSRLLFSSAEMFKKPLWQTMWTHIRLL